VLLSLAVGAVAAVVWLTGNHTAAAVVASVYCLGYAAVVLVGMIRQLLAGRVGIDLLAVSAIVATVLVGEWVASLIVVLMLCTGEALEDYAQRRARRDLTLLLSAEPTTARRVDPGTAAVTVIPADDVRVGDELLVLSGEVVPVDGLLTSDMGAFDTSSLTGESLPVELVRDDRVLSGSVNGSRSVTLRATATARESQLQSIAHLVTSAGSRRSPLVRLADRFAVPFTVVSFAIAGIAWALSGDPTRFAAVLVLATPCPLLLAAPVAFVGGLSRAAREGVVVKGGDVLERLARVRSIAFDKTGTLTRGDVSVTRVVAEPGWSEDEVLRYAASAESSSSHVLADSILTAARERNLALSAVSASVEREARGVDAMIGDQHVLVGTRRFVSEAGSDVPEIELEGGEVGVYVALGGRYIGCIIGSDPLRPEAPAAIRELERLGIARIVMLTGDAESTALHVAAQAGVREVEAGCLPGDKVRRLRAIEPRPVAMVGDGVNDAPVLAAADVGLALASRGASITSETADAVILREDLGLVPVTLELSRRAMRIALQSIGLGIMLSVVLMLVAATGAIPATLGAALQELVDLATILNALRVTRIRVSAAA